MSKKNFIKAVEFKITARGEGIVNHNGSSPVYNPAAGKTIENHLMPKILGFNPMVRMKTTEGDKTMPLSLADPMWETAAIYVSPACMRKALFSYFDNIQEVTRDMAAEVLSNPDGLMRGYLITEGGANFARKSPLRLGKMICWEPGLVYNQGSKSGARTETSIYSYFETKPDIEYVGYGSISIEDFFIPLENTMGRSQYSEVVTKKDGEALAATITQNLKDQSGREDVGAKFVLAARRKGASKKGFTEAGIMLNEAAIDFIIENFLDNLRTLVIRQGKGHLYVTDVALDYNDGHSMRIKTPGRESQVQPTKTKPYYEYFEEVEQDEKEFDKRMVELKSAADVAKAKKAAEKADAAAKKAAKKAAGK